MSEYIYGKNAVKEALINNKRIICLYATDSNKDIIDLARRSGINYRVTDMKVINKMVTGLHQGVVLEVQDYKYSKFEELLVTNYKYPFIVVLDGLEDPHNLGAILRTCDASGVDGVIIPKNRSVGLNATVAKVSTGAIEYVKVAEVTNIAQTLKILKDKGYWIVGAEATDKSVDFRSMKYDMPTVLVVGSEGKGISRIVRESCDFLVQIPMVGHVNSLNASVSCSILIYEIMKYREV
ncbi:MAG: 23S rRNA (guanosine(2251)-2'-O)-methyltransferase RlmB [Bacilli bacterium]